MQDLSCWNPHCVILLTSVFQGGRQGQEVAGEEAEPRALHVVPQHRQEPAAREIQRLPGEGRQGSGGHTSPWAQGRSAAPNPSSTIRALNKNVNSCQTASP